MEQPTLSKDLIDQVTLSRADGETAVLLSNDGDGHYTGLLVEPTSIPWIRSRPRRCSPRFPPFAWVRARLRPTPKPAPQYGLDDPELTLWIHQAAGTVGQVDESGQLAAVEVREQALRFVIGAPRESFSIPANTQAAAIWSAAFCWRRWLPATPDTLVARQPADLGGAALSDILIESPLGDVHVTAQYTERVLPNNDIETDAEGNTVYDTAVTLNGEEADAELLTTLTTRLNALTASGDLPTDGPCPRTRRRAGASFSPRWAAPRVRSPPTGWTPFPTHWQWTAWPSTTCMRKPLI